MRYFRPKNTDGGSQGINDITTGVRSDAQPQRHEAININTRVLASNGCHQNEHEANVPVNTEDQEKDYDSDYSEVVVMHAAESLGSQTIFDYENVAHNPGIYSIYSEATEYEEAASDKKRASTAAVNTNFEFSAHGYENVTYDRDETDVNSGVLAEHAVHERKGKTDDKLPPPVMKKRPPVKKKPRRVETSSKSDGNTASQSVIVPMSVYDEVKFEYGAQLESTSVYQNFSDDQQSSHVTRKESDASFSQTQMPQGQNRHHYNKRTIMPGPEVTYYNQREMSKDNDEASYYNHRAIKSRNHNQS